MNAEWQWLYNEAEEKKLQEIEENREKTEIQIFQNLAKRYGVSW